MAQLDAAVVDNGFESIGLAFDPFAGSAMPDFFFVGGQRRFLVQRAVHTLYFSGGMVLVLGANGAGKSRLIDEICVELRDIADICRIDATVMMNGAQVRALLAKSVGLILPPASSIAEVVQALGQIRADGEDPLPLMLMIDSAHMLSIDALTETAALVQSSGGRLRLLLAGEESLIAAWQQAHVGAAETLRLQALDRTEVADYLHTRLQAAGATVPIPLDAALLDALFAQTAGNIGAIHAVAPQLLRPQPTATASPRAKSLPFLHIGAIAALLALVIVLMLYRGSKPAATDSDAVTAPGISALTDKRSIPLALPAPAPAPAMPVKSPAPAAPAPASVPEKPVQKVEPLPSPTRLAAPQPARQEPKAVALAAKPVPEKLPVAEDKLPVKAVKGADAVSSDEGELLALSSKQFVLQLLGSESRAGVDKFAASAGKGQHLLTYRTQLNGKSWFIVMAGPYPTKEAAQAAISKLPDALRKQQPWPRSVASVQADIRAYSGKH